MIGVEFAGVRPHGFSFAGGRAYVWAISSGRRLHYAIKIDLNQWPDDRRISMSGRLPLRGL
ncbi:hypothetical protein KIP88_43140 [Bradyrhizobium sp. SRL28]|uniref:hypothetical protein n=1 Tax=Bradyrhizobium sp. SRL28 TaxID=2836178 RepID=UPI001BDE6978|nr:hypothetical protein [Bradyrhizobium sp. SRL28]MBT1517144.1 hypothetical protein [Bradyrhizobium sp. SRL28]